MGTSSSSSSGISTISIGTIWILACCGFLVAIVAITACQSSNFDFIGGFKSKLFSDQSLTNNALGGENAITQSRNRDMIIDKSLGGLFAAEHIEASCISRYQSHLYRKPSPYKHSPYLVSKLRNYEALHKKCAPDTALYKRTVSQLKSGVLIPDTGCNYMVWIDLSGLGNKILTITTAFIYTLLTNRVLLIAQNDDLASLFCEPFPNTSWFLPVDFPLNLSSLNTQHDHSFRNIVVRKPNPNITVERSPYVYIQINHDYILHDQLIFCDDYHAPLQKLPWLFLRANNYFVPAFFLMSSFEQELANMFPNKEAVFHLICRYLFQLSNKAWGMITRYYDSYLSRSDKIVGIQVRVFGNARPFEQRIMNRIVRCTSSEKLLPELDTTQVEVSPNSTYKSIITVLVVSLYPGYSENLKFMHWTTPTKTREVIAVHQPSHEDFERSGDSMHSMKAWVEMNLLSLSDVLVTSASSTFGYVAQGLGGIRPWIFHKDRNGSDPEAACRRVMSMEPCFLVPPNYNCKTRTRNATATSAPFLRHCEDRDYLGAKLINDNTSISK